MKLTSNTNLQKSSKPTLHKAEWLLIFVLVFASRLLTSAYYIEEPDSLRFALAVKEFDIVKLQPHFPGYPVFCWLSQILFAVTGSMAISFSIIGAASISAIIFSVVSVFTLLIKAFSRLAIYVIVILLFFNPLLWILSTSYMPDCMGTALVCLILMFTCKAVVQSDIRYIILAQVFTGILFGARLSYVPFVIIPSLYLLIIFKQRILQIASGLISIIIWLIPVIYLTGFTKLIAAAQTHTDGHFNDWGGSYITENNIPLRFIMLIRGIWADGLGGYWSGRNMLTLFSSVIIFAIIVFSIIQSRRKKAILNRKILLLIISSTVVYITWIIFGQNIIYKARHVLPVLPVLIIFLVLAINTVLQWKIKPALTVLIPFVLIYAYTGTFLAWQHTKPTAISQAKEYILQHSNNKTVIVSTGLVNDYLRAHAVEAKLVEITGFNEILKYKSIFPAHDIWYVGIDADRILPIKEIHSFYHNPYVNRMWPVIEVIKL